MKTSIIKFSPLHFHLSQLITEHNNTTLSEVPDTKFLGVQIDSHLKWKCHVDQIVILCTKSESLTNDILCLLSFSYHI